MSMTSYRNSENVWDNYTLGQYSDSAFWFLCEADPHKSYSVKNTYRNRVYYARYYCENADPIVETCRRGMVFV